VLDFQFGFKVAFQDSYICLFQALNQLFTLCNYCEDSQFNFKVLRFGPQVLLTYDTLFKIYYCGRQLICLSRDILDMLCLKLHLGLMLGLQFSFRNKSFKSLDLECAAPYLLHQQERNFSQLLIYFSRPSFAFLIVKFPHFQR